MQYKNAKLFKLPKGVQNFLKEECYNKSTIEKAILSNCSLWGYDEVEVSPIEYYDNYLYGETRIEQNRMVKFSDEEGNLVVLTPDITLPLLRLAIKDGSTIKKYCYKGNVFDNYESVHTKSKVQYQVGVEYIGVDSLNADVEVICLAIESLKKAGLKNFKIDIGEVNFYKGIMQEYGIDENTSEEIRKLIDKKNQLGVQMLIKNSKAATVINSLPTLFGGIEVIEKARKLCKNAVSQKALSDIEYVTSCLSECGYGEYISIDLALVQRISYYSGIVFRGLAQGFGTPIMQGGRYDELSKAFSSSLAATGFAIELKKLLMCLEGGDCLKKLDDVDTILYCEGSRSYAIEYCQKLRGEGKSVFEVFANSIQQFKEIAKTQNAKNIIYINKANEVENI